MSVSTVTSIAWTLECPSTGAPPNQMAAPAPTTSWSGSPTFGRTIALLTGDTVDFELGARGDWSYDNTPTSIRVTRR